MYANRLLSVNETECSINTQNGLQEDSLKGKKTVESTVGPAGKATALPSHSSIARLCEAPEAHVTQKEQV